MDAYVNSLTSYLLAQSWQIALLAVIVTLISFLLRNRSAHVRYLLWLIVLAKCIVPPVYSVAVPVLPERPLMERLPNPVSPQRQVVGPIVKAVVQPHEFRLALPSTKEMVILTWLTGMFLFLLWVGSRAVRYHLWLHRRRMPVPSALAQEFHELFVGFKFKKSPRLWLTRGIAQPFVWGLFQGSIYLPADFVGLNNPQHHRTVLVHELSHVARFDAAVNLIQILAQAIFWFHPFVWWVNKKIRQEREKCCDEMTVAQLSTPPENYTEVIVEALAAERRSGHPVPSLAIVGSIKDIEERIKTMLRPGKKFYKHPTLVTITAALLLALLAVPASFVLTARAQTEPAAAQSPEFTRSIYYAASVGDIEQVRLHIANGSDVNEKTTFGDTALHYAVRYGREDVVKLLIANGADVNEKNADGDTPLHYAARYAQGPSFPSDAGNDAYKDVAELLISAGADVSAKNNYGDLSIQLALRGNLSSEKAKVLELLIAKGPTLSSIQMAAFQGDLAKVKRFLEQGISVDSRDSEGRAALHYAALHGKRDVVEFLLSQGANVNLKDKSMGFVPLHMVCGDKDIVEMLIAKGADVNAKDKYGWTPLDTAVYGQKDIVALLIRAGANVNSRYDWGQTPLFWAAQAGQADVADLLIANGAEIDARDENGRTALYHAAWWGNRDVAELLISKGANVNVRDVQGHSPLWQAKNRGNKEIAELLRRHGAKE